MNTVESNEFSTYFQTSLRNVRLFTSLAYGSLAYSRLYRNDNPFYEGMLLLVSLAFLAISVFLNYLLYLDSKSFVLKNKQDNDSNQSLRITQATFGIQLILLFIGIIILVRN